jgi:type III pantothenate kinase
MGATLLLLDVGNTRLKWRAVDGHHGFGAHDPEGWVALDDRNADATLVAAWRACAARRASISNVAGRQAGERVVALLRTSSAGIALSVLESSRQCGAVRNGYGDPASLGTDRWAALIGARALYPERELLIASFGTATTIDHLSADGEFDGGVILPGYALMRASLAQGTAGLPLAHGDYQALARDTGSAIVTGITHAQAGALERVRRLCGWDDANEADQHGQRVVLLTGGGASSVAPLLHFPATIVDNLVLRGLYVVARETLIRE